MLSVSSSGGHQYQQQRTHIIVDGGHFQEVTSFPSPHQSLLADTTSKAMQSKRYLSRGQRCCVCKKQKKLDC